MNYYISCAHAEPLINMMKEGAMNFDLSMIIFWNISCAAIV